MEGIVNMNVSPRFEAMIPIQRGVDVKRNGEKKDLNSGALVVPARTIEEYVTIFRQMEDGTLPKGCSRIAPDSIPALRTQMANLQKVDPSYQPGEPVIHLVESLEDWEYRPYLIAGEKDVNTAWETYKEALHRQLDQQLEAHKASVPKDFLITPVHKNQYEITLNNRAAQQEAVQQLKTKLDITAPVEIEKPEGLTWPLKIKPYTV
jgi:hypothetical protein